MQTTQTSETPVSQVTAPLNQVKKEADASKLDSDKVSAESPPAPPASVPENVTVMDASRQLPEESADHDQALAGTRGSTAAAYETAHKAVAEADGLKFRGEGPPAQK